MVMLAGSSASTSLRLSVSAFIYIRSQNNAFGCVLMTSYPLLLPPHFPPTQTTPPHASTFRPMINSGISSLYSMPRDLSGRWSANSSPAIPETKRASPPVHPRHVEEGRHPRDHVEDQAGNSQQSRIHAALLVRHGRAAAGGSEGGSVSPSPSSFNCSRSRSSPTPCPLLHCAAAGAD